MVAMYSGSVIIGYNWKGEGEMYYLRSRVNLGCLLATLRVPFIDIMRRNTRTPQPMKVTRLPHLAQTLVSMTDFEFKSSKFRITVTESRCMSDKSKTKSGRFNMIV